MTDAQAMALAHAMEILSEHFESAVIGVGYDTSDHTDGNALSIHGGRMNAVGLCEAVKFTILKSLGHPAQDGPATA